MIRTAVKILHYPKETENTWSATSTEILNTIDLQSNNNIETKSDTFQFQLYAESTINIHTYGLDDKFEVFAKNFAEGEDITEIDTENNNEFDATFIYSGVLNNWRHDTGEDGTRQLIIQGASFSERLLKTALPAGYISEGATIHNTPTIIQNLLEIVNDNSGGKNIYWDPTNPPLNSEGNAFKTISYATQYKPVYQHIMDLSQDKYTGDGAYYFYIRSDHSGNYLHWQKRDSVVISGTIIENQHFVLPKVEYGVWDAVNYLIINAGQDPKGNGITTYAVDIPSLGEIGMRSKYIPIDAAEALHQVEQQGNRASFGSESRFPISYPYTTKFEDPDFPQEVLADESEYLSWFRRAAKFIAEKKGNEYINKYKYARYKMKAEAPYGEKLLVLGEVYKINSPTVGFVGSRQPNLRLVDIINHINDDGWVTEYSFEQDWEAVVLEQSF